MSTRGAKRPQKRYVYETIPAPGVVRPPRSWGYGRISTFDQSTELQVSALSACDQVITDEGVSGSTEGATRPGLSKLLGALASGDTVVVWKLDRLGRSLTDLCGLVKTLEDKGVIFKSITEGFDMSTPAGKFMFHMLAACAEFERAMIRERVLAGVKNAQANGVHCGRKPKLSAIQMDTIRDMVKKGKSLLTIAATFHVSKRTISRALAHAPGGVIQ